MPTSSQEERNERILSKKNAEKSKNVGRGAPDAPDVPETTPDVPETAPDMPETVPETAPEPSPSPEQCLQAQLNEKSDQLLRLAAEYDNFRKRSQREREALYQAVKADTVKEFLSVLDNFGRASENTEADYADYKKGMDMIFQQFCDILKKLGVEEFGAAGDAFDPNIHNAVMHIEDENRPQNCVAQVFSKGYRVGEQLLRPATVQVAN